jgi:hypothetical protein
MGHDDRREIFERLEALERMVRSRSGEHDHRHGGRDRRHHDRRDRDRDRDDRHDRDERRGRDHEDRHERGRHDRGHRGGDDRYRGGGDGEFQEKRIIDTIVQLVGERLERFIQDQQAKTPRRDDGSNERRVIEHVVRQVGENVRQIVQGIVSSELDRRVGPPQDERRGRPSPHGEREPE